MLYPKFKDLAIRTAKATAFTDKEKTQLYDYHNKDSIRTQLTRFFGLPTKTQRDLKEMIDMTHQQVVNAIRLK